MISNKFSYSLAFYIENTILNKTYKEDNNTLQIQGNLIFELGILKIRYFHYKNEINNDSFTTLFTPFYHSEYFSEMKFDKVNIDYSIYKYLSINLYNIIL